MTVSRSARRAKEGRGTRPKETKRKCPAWPGRGRPPVRWTSTQQKRLLRLYLFTPASELPLAHILLILADGTFIPKERRTQDELKKLLSKGEYWKMRPKDREAMRRRMEFLRGARQEVQNRHNTQHFRLRTASEHHRYGVGNREISRQKSSPDLPAGHDLSTLPQMLELADSGMDGLQFWDGEFATFGGHSPDTMPVPTHAHAHNPSTNTPDRSVKKLLRMSFLRSRLPGSRTHSFLADVASLFSSISLRSISSTSKRDSTSSRQTARSGSEWISSVRSVSPDPPPANPSSIEETPADTQSIRAMSQRTSSETDRHHRENAYLLASCCFQPGNSDAEPPCIHRRLLDAINDVKENVSVDGNFVVQKHEADEVDSRENTLLHIAARWGAPVSILTLIIKQMTNVSAVNGNGETFLHLLNPSTELPLTPRDFAALTKVLRRRRFNFRRLDNGGRTCLNRLILNRAFPFEALDAFFEEVSPTLAVWLISNKSRKGERLFHCLCRKLHQQNMDIPDGLADGAEQTVLGKYDVKLFEKRVGENKSANRDSAPRIQRQRGAKESRHYPPSGSDTRESELEAFMQELVRDDYDVNKADPVTGRTPLMELLRALGSCYQMNQAGEDVIQRMLKRNASLSLTDKTGNTSLHYAAEAGLPSVVRTFCLYKADVNSTNQFGQTPLHLTKVGIQRKDMLRGVKLLARYMECATILLERGSNHDSPK